MAFVTISGNLFALSGEQTATLSAVVFALLMSHKIGFAASFVVTIGFGAGLGLLQAGVIVAGANPIIATLAFGALFEGLATFLATRGMSRSTPCKLLGLARVDRSAFRPKAGAFVMLTIVAAVVIRKTQNREVPLCSAAGQSRYSGKQSRSNLERHAVRVDVLLSRGGLLDAAAAQFSLAKPTLFDGLNIDVIAAVLVGGIALKGGRGSPVQAALGAVSIALAEKNLMLLNGVTTGFRMFVVGALVIASIAIFNLSTERVDDPDPKELRVCRPSGADGHRLRRLRVSDTKLLRNCGNPRAPRWRRPNRHRGCRRGRDHGTRESSTFLSDRWRRSRASSPSKCCLLVSALRPSFLSSLRRCSA